MKLIVVLNYEILGPPFDRLAPIQRSARSSVSVTSHATSRGVVTVDDGGYTNKPSDNNFRESNKTH